MKIDELIRELKMDFELLEKVVPREYLLMRFDNLNKRGLIKKLYE